MRRVLSLLLILCLLVPMCAQAETAYQPFTLAYAREVFLSFLDGESEYMKDMNHTLYWEPHGFEKGLPNLLGAVFGVKNPEQYAEDLASLINSIIVTANYEQGKLLFKAAIGDLNPAFGFDVYLDGDVVRIHCSLCPDSELVIDRTLVDADWKQDSEKLLNWFWEKSETNETYPGEHDWIITEDVVAEWLDELGIVSAETIREYLPPMACVLTYYAAGEGSTSWELTTYDARSGEMTGDFRIGWNDEIIQYDLSWGGKDANHFTYGHIRSLEGLAMDEFPDSTVFESIRVRYVDPQRICKSASEAAEHDELITAQTRNVIIVYPNREDGNSTEHYTTYNYISSAHTQLPGTDIELSGYEEGMFWDQDWWVYESDGAVAVNSEEYYSVGAYCALTATESISWDEVTASHKNVYYLTADMQEDDLTPLAEEVSEGLQDLAVQLFKAIPAKLLIMLNSIQ